MPGPRKAGSKTLDSATTAPAPRSSKIAPARTAAFQILRELESSPSAHSDDLLQGPRLEALSEQDRNLCTALVMGVLRWQLALDAEIEKFLNHKSKLDGPVRTTLRLGVFQLILLDRIPVHAAISDSVELTKRAGHRFASGLVNAVLRKAAAEAEMLKGSLRGEAAHPRWLVERWQSNFGAEAASLVCGYDQQQPPITLRLVDAGAEAALDHEEISLASGGFLARARTVTSGNVASSELLKQGQVRLQDEGSQLVAELLGHGSGEVKAILDCCAAPGGKTAILAERYPLARVLACDISVKRLEAMQQRFEAKPSLGNIEYISGDITTMPFGAMFKLILCDVPCSGTGTMARNPEIRHRLQPEDLLRQQERQIAILQAALRHLAPGGQLLYSTCSLEPEENEQVVERVLRGDENLQGVPIEERVRDLRADGTLHEQGAAHLQQHAARGGFLRTIPGVSPCDGFFAALLTRKQ